MSRNSKQRRRSIRHTHRGVLAPIIWRNTVAFRWVTEERWFEQRREAEEVQQWISIKVLPMLQRAGYWSHNPEILGEMTLADFLQEISYDSDLSAKALAAWEELNHTWLTT